MLWEVISDEEIFKFLSRTEQSNISQIFLNNIQGFYELERLKTTNLTDINKKYILLILNHIKKQFSQQIPQKIKIEWEIDDYDTNNDYKDNYKKIKEVKKEIQPRQNIQPRQKLDLYTFEEIQDERKTQFDDDLKKRQEEFTNSMSLQIPEIPDFEDKYHKDLIPAEEMGSLIQEMIKKRNYDVNQISNTYKNDLNNDWLQSQETSIQNDKFNTNNSKFKEKEKDKEKEDTKLKKNVTWNNILEDENNLNFDFIIEKDVEKEDINIFSKLKTIKSENIDNISVEKIEPIKKIEKIEFLENQIISLNKKVDMIIELLQQK